VVADAFEAVIPVINKFGSTIADVFKGNKTVADFVDEVMDSIENLISNFEKNAPQFLAQGEKLLTSLVEGIQRTVPKLIALVVPMINRLAQTFISNLGTILDTGIKILITIINGITQALPQLIQQIPTIISTIVTVLLKNMPEIIKAGVQIIVALVQGIIQMIPNLIQSAGQILKAIWESLKDAPRMMLDIGKQIVQGIWSGISNTFGWIKDKIRGWVGDVLGFFKKMFGIHSPSKVFADVIGANLALGIGEGFDDEMGAVARSMTDAIPMSFGMSGSGSYRQTNLGGVNITVNGAEGQNVQELADEIMFRMQTAVSRREMVFA
jgi:phage-related protein